MKVTKISGNSAIAGQLFFLFAILPCFIFLFYLMFDGLNLTFDSLISGEAIFLLLPIVILFFIVKNGFSKYDVYSEGDELIFKNLFFKKRKFKDQIKEIDRGFTRGSYCISFNDGSDFYFLCSISESFKTPGKVISIIKEKIFNSDI